MDEQAISDAVRAVSRVDDVFADPTGPEVFPWIGAPKYSNAAFHLGMMARLGAGAPSSSEWTLSLVIRHHGEFIGVIDLWRRRIPGFASSDGEDLRGLLRDLGLKADDSYVETGSYILRSFQGRGFATQARRAALTVAFTYCGFSIAVSESWLTNAASQVVSLSCGYTFLGESRYGINGASATVGGSDVGSNNVGNENEKMRMYCTPDMFNCGSTSVHVDGWTPELAAMLGVQN